MHGSDAGAVDGAVVVALDGEAPAISVERISRFYTPPSFGSAQRFFSLFGGLEADVAVADFGDDGDDDDDDDDDTDADTELAIERGTTASMALDSLSLRVSGSGCVGIVGPKNSGKSVLLRTIAGLSPPSSGRIVVHGTVAPVLTSLAGVVPSRGKLRRVLPTVGGFLGFPPSHVRRVLPEIFELLGDPELGNKAVRTFVGKQRLSLLFALILTLDPDILIVDCALPSGALGEACRERMLELKRCGSLVLIAARRVEDIAWIADHVVYLTQGSVTGAERIDVALAAGAAAEREPAAESELSATDVRSRIG